MERYISKETGTIITPEMIEALAAEAEEGYDLDLGAKIRSTDGS